MWRVIIMVLAMVLAVPLALARDEDDAAASSTVKTVAMSERVYKVLQEARQHIEEENYQQARQLLVAAQTEQTSEYEMAQIYNLEGYSWYLQQEYPSAISAYQKILAYHDLPEALVLSTVNTLSQLYFFVENYSKALEMGLRLVAASNSPDSDIYMLIGQSHYQLEQYRQAVDPVKEAIAIQQDNGIAPEEPQLLLLRAIYYQLEDYQAMLEVTTELAARYPDVSYITAIAGIYSELGQTEKQLTLTAAVYEKGLLDVDRHAFNLASLYLLHGLPYKAAQVLEKEINAGNIERNHDNLKLLSQAWYQARETEKSIAPLQQAAGYADNGELYLLLAQLYSDLEQWQQVAENIQLALDKGGIADASQARLRLGMALFNSNRIGEAADIFGKLQQGGDSKLASQWLEYIQSERQRRQAIEALP